MNSVTVSLPLPPKCLHPNAGQAQTRRALLARNTAKKKYRKACGQIVSVLWTGNRGPKWERATARAVFYFTTNRRRDSDNLNAWLKAAFDSFQDAGLIANDHGLTHLSPHVEHVADPWAQRVDITVEPVP